MLFPQKIKTRGGLGDSSLPSASEPRRRHRAYWCSIPYMGKNTYSCVYCHVIAGRVQSPDREVCEHLIDSCTKHRECKGVSCKICDSKKIPREERLVGKEHTNLCAASWAKRRKHCRVCDKCLSAHIYSKQDKHGPKCRAEKHWPPREKFSTVGQSLISPLQPINVNVPVQAFPIRHVSGVPTPYGQQRIPLYFPVHQPIPPEQASMGTVTVPNTPENTTPRQFEGRPHKNRGLDEQTPLHKMPTRTLDREFSVASTGLLGNLAGAEWSGTPPEHVTPTKAVQSRISHVVLPASSG